MLDTPRDTLQFLLGLGYPPDEVARTVVERFGVRSEAAVACARQLARWLQEEEIQFAHTVIEHEAAVAAEWSED